MEFKYSVSMLFSRMGYLMKVLVWVLICIVIAGSIGTGLMVPIVRAFRTNDDVATQLNEVVSVVKDTVYARNNIFEAIVELIETVNALAGELLENTGAFVGFIFVALFVYMLYSFLIGLIFYPTSDMINKMMSSSMKFGLASALAMNFKNAARYSFARCIVTLPVDVVIILIIYGLFVGLFKGIGLVCLPFILLVTIILVSLRSTLFAGWLPRFMFNPKEKVLTSFYRSLVAVKANFRELIKAYAITTSLTYMLIVGFAIPTFGLILIIAPAMYYFMLRAIELVGYYKMNEMCFYVDDSNVINTRAYGYRADNQNKD